MEKQPKRLLTAREAADYLGISIATLSRMDKDRQLVPFRTPGGHRRYSLTMLNEYLEGSRRPPPAVTSAAAQSRSIEVEQVGGDRESTDDKASILIVDDDDGMCETLSDIMEDKGYRAYIALDGYEAVEKAREMAFGVILMDIRMPGINGVETFRLIKSIQPDAVVVMMTAYAVEDLVMEALREGAYSVLYKPFEMERMINLIDGMKDGGLILVVDDDAQNCEVFKDLLGERGYQVSIAFSGEEAIEMMRENSYDMVFIDMKLPAMNGLETYLVIKEINPQTVAVMMTGYHREVKDLVAEALEKDAYTCLYKPFDAGQVIELVDEICHRKL